MSIRKPAHSGKGANTPTQTPTPTETSQPRECLNDTIKRLAAQLDEPNGYSVQTFMPLYEVICRKLERSATVASQHTSQLDRRALLDVECTISTALQRLECFAELMADMLVNMPADAGANALYSLLWAIEEQARAITEANHAIAAIRTGGQS